jgi:hypothetical protein
MAESGTDASVFNLTGYVKTLVLDAYESAFRTLDETKQMSEEDATAIALAMLKSVQEHAGSFSVATISVPEGATLVRKGNFEPYNPKSIEDSTRANELTGTKPWAIYSDDEPDAEYGIRLYYPRATTGNPAWFGVIATHRIGHRRVLVFNGCYELKMNE